MRKQRELLKKSLLYAGLNQNEYGKIKQEIQESNQQNIKTFSALAVVFLTLLFVISFYLPAARGNRWLYFGLLCVVLILFFITKYCKLNEALTLVCVYIFCGLFLGLGAILGTVAVPDKYAVTFVAMIFMGPLLFTDRPLRMICNSVFYVIVFIIAAILFKDQSVLLTDMIHVCLFSLISLTIGFYMTKVKCQRYLFEQQVKTLSETDLLTGLRNRNSFELNKNSYPSVCKKSICCIFIDANGLHELNNASGHDAGDKMLQDIGEILRLQFGSENVYRIGGDEFVAFSIDEEAEKIEEKLQGIKLSDDSNKNCFSIGYDVQYCGEIDMHLLIKNAEKRMYEEKKQYYDCCENTETARSQLRNQNSKTSG